MPARVSLPLKIRTIMKQKSYRWLGRLIDKITQNDCPNNTSFEYYGHDVTLQSGTRDYVDVNITTQGRHQISFTFDFWLKDLCFETYNEYEERDAIIKAFKSIYGSNNVTIDSDEPWEEEERFYLPMLDNDEYDQETIRKEYDTLLSHKAA